jgi:hypothetical protein
MHSFPGLHKRLTLPGGTTLCQVSASRVHTCMALCELSPGREGPPRAVSRPLSCSSGQLTANIFSLSRAGLGYSEEVAPVSQKFPPKSKAI